MKIEFKSQSLHIEDGAVVSLTIDVKDRRKIGDDMQYFASFNWTSCDNGTPNVYHSTLAHWRKADNLDELIENIKQFVISYKAKAV